MGRTSGTVTVTLRFNSILIVHSESEHLKETEAISYDEDVDFDLSINFKREVITPINPNSTVNKINPLNPCLG
jgi:hypothetical protein